MADDNSFEVLFKTIIDIRLLTNTTNMSYHMVHLFARKKLEYIELKDSIDERYQSKLKSC